MFKLTVTTAGPCGTRDVVMFIDSKEKELDDKVGLFLAGIEQLEGVSDMGSAAHRILIGRTLGPSSIIDIKEC